MPRHFATDLGIKIKVDFNHLLKFMQGYSYENQKKNEGPMIFLQGMVKSYFTVTGKCRKVNPTRGIEKKLCFWYILVIQLSIQN